MSDDEYKLKDVLLSFGIVNDDLLRVLNEKLDKTVGIQ
jgi:hypothetical protein